MTMLRRIFLGLVIVAAVLLALAYLLPREVHVERSITVDAPAPVVYGLVSDFRRFNEFSPWSEYDPKARYSYSGAPGGVGAKMSWHSEQPSVGSGSQEIVAAEPGRSVRIALDFGAQGTAHSSWLIEPAGDASQVVWAFDIDLGNDPIARYMGLTLERFVGADYEKGLAKLKAVAEAQAAKADADAAAPAAAPAPTATPDGGNAAPAAVEDPR